MISALPTAGLSKTSRNPRPHGLTRRRGYTRRMASNPPLRYESGDLCVYPERGEVSNSRGESTRLGPVDMRVLTLLLSRHGQVVSRNELFESVWKNQLVSDDVLTRCISDIRAELSRLSAGDKHIETIPKRGYRWLAAVRASSTPTGSRTEALAEPAARRPDVDPRPPLQHLLLKWMGRGAAYVVTLVAMASIGVWLMDRFTGTAPVVIAVLPMSAGSPELELVTGIEKSLAEYLRKRNRLALLSRSAVESRPSNPFPYFRYEFGARWLVESELQRRAEETIVTVALVDARSGIVLFQSRGLIEHDSTPTAAALEPIFRPLSEFIDSQLN